MTRDLWTGVKSVPQHVVTSLYLLVLGICLSGTNDDVPVPHSSNKNAAELIVRAQSYLNGKYLQSNTYA